jgi:hypothetical protein
MRGPRAGGSNHHPAFLSLGADSLVHKVRAQAPSFPVFPFSHQITTNRATINAERTRRVGRRRRSAGRATLCPRPAAWEDRGGSRIVLVPSLLSGAVRARRNCSPCLLLRRRPAFSVDCHPRRPTSGKMSPTSSAMFSTACRFFRVGCWGSGARFARTPARVRRGSSRRRVISLRRRDSTGLGGPPLAVGFKCAVEIKSRGTIGLGWCGPSSPDLAGEIRSCVLKSWPSITDLRASGAYRFSYDRVVIRAVRIKSCGSHPTIPLCGHNSQKRPSVLLKSTRRPLGDCSLCLGRLTPSPLCSCLNEPQSSVVLKWLNELEIRFLI